MAYFDTKTVCEIVEITAKQVDYWDKTGLIRPSIAQARGYGSRRLYSFAELVQFRVAKSFKDSGISLQKIRKSLRYLGEHYPNIKRPLATLKFLTDGETIFEVSSNKSIIVDTLDRGQIVHVIALGKLIQDLKSKARISTIKWQEDVNYGGKQYRVLIEPDIEDGGYIVECLDIKGCLSQGETREESLKNIKDAIKECLVVLRKKAKAANVS